MPLATKTACQDTSGAPKFRPVRYDAPSPKVLLFALMLAGAPVAAAAETLTVFAAASLKNAVDEIATRWSDATGERLALSYAGSSTLARQIEAGAPADIFLSADVRWMDYLAERDLLLPGSRFDLVGNTLVLVAHGADAAPVEIVPGFDLAGHVGRGRLAMALVEAVPAGVYGKAALEALGVWDDVAPKVVQADNVRAALAFVATGEAPLGIVYTTDALADERVSVVGTFPAGTHPPIVYQAAALADSDQHVEPFLRFFQSDAAQEIFERHGFRPLAD